MFQLNRIQKSYGGQNLFRNVTWLIQAGDRVGLVGPNGSGKTTLMGIIAGFVPPDDGETGRSRGATVGYLAQEVEKIGDSTVLETARGGAEEIVRLETEIAAIEKLMIADNPESGNNSSSLHSEGDKTANSSSENLPSGQAKKSKEELAIKHGEMLERFNALDGYGLDAKVQTVLSGLGFKPETVNRSISTLSGGWIMRAALARLLVAQPDLLLLDEPTNHLDLESIRWLETFLTDYPGAWVIVSHDRYFLERHVSKIAELTPEGIFVYEGSYEKYLKQRQELAERLEKEAEGHRKRIAELQGFIDRFKAKASKARQANSKARLIEKLESEKAEREAPLAAALSQKKRPPRFRMPEVERSGDIAIRVSDVKKAYGDNVVYECLNFEASRGERIALVGPNGAGKSTLLKLLAEAIKPDSGEIIPGHNINRYYFAQHQTDALNLKETVLSCMRELLPTEPESVVRGILGAFLFEGDDVLKKAGVLSGGEKARLALARMLAKPCNLLLLDEPTNHLDIESRNVLETALFDYSGTMIFISHDRWFINRIATRVVEITHGGIVISFPGDYDYYLWKKDQIHAQEKSADQNGISGEKGISSSAQTKSERELPAKGRMIREARKEADRKLRRREREKKKLENEIEISESRMAEIDQLMCDPKVYADASQCRNLLSEREAIEMKLPGIYEKWAELCEEEDSFEQ